MMNLMKTAFISVGLVSILGLTACQSTSQAAPNTVQQIAKSERQFKGEGRHHFQQHGYRGHHESRMRGAQHRGPLTEEQKVKFEKLRTERKAKYEALQKACEGKAGQNISVKVGENTLTGTCQVSFHPDRPQAKRMPVAPQTTAPAAS